MEHHELDVGHYFYGKMVRKRRGSAGEVVMVIRRPGGKVLLNTKEFYPEGVYRLLSGKMKGRESPDDTLEREAYEETGLRVRVERYLGKIGYVLTSPSGIMGYVSHVFLTEQTTGEPAPIDAEERITDFREEDPCELQHVAQGLRSLPEDWADWGRFRAIAHDLVYRELCPQAD